MPHQTNSRPSAVLAAARANKERGTYDQISKYLEARDRRDFVYKIQVEQVADGNWAAMVDLPGDRCRSAGTGHATLDEG
jgi:hypothetical protein